MNLKALLLLQPGRLIRSGIPVLCVLITLLVGYLHTLTGLSCEFHVFLILPVLVVSWLNGKGLGYGVAVLAAVAGVHRRLVISKRSSQRPARDFPHRRSKSALHTPSRLS